MQTALLHARTSLRTWLIPLFAAASTNVWSATYHVDLINFEFVPANLSIQVGDTVTWHNTEGAHNVVEDSNIFTSGLVTSDPFEYSVTFDSLGQVGYYCATHGGPGGVGMAGTVDVVSAGTFDLNYGITGSWWDSATAGQGFSIEMIPESEEFVAYWFTHNLAGTAQKWLVAAGAYSGNRAETIVYEPTGGVFDQSTPPVEDEWGSAIFEFADCNSGSVTYYSPLDGISGIISLQRLTDAAACP